MNPGHMRNRLNSRGFSLLEMSIALIILGLVTGSILAAYNIQMKKRRLEAVQAQLSYLQNAMNVFFLANGRYPRPARLDLPTDHPDYGVEVTVAVANAAQVGVCADGLCRVNSDIPAVGGQILYGTIPVRTLRITDENMLDPWKNKYSYAVTQNLTATATFNRMHGNIYVRRLGPDGVTVVDMFPYTGASGLPAGHFVIFSHGENKNGAYTAAGVLNSDSMQIDPGTGAIARLCDPTLSDESENCDNDGTFFFNTRKSFANVGPGFLADSFYYDDFMIAANGVASSGLWQNVASGTDIYSLNAVGVGTTDVGVQLTSDGNVVRNGVGVPVRYSPTTLPYATSEINLDVDGNIRVPNVIVGEICNLEGTECFSPEVLGGIGHIECGETGGVAAAVSGIAHSSARCASFPVTVSGSCPSGEIAIGILNGVIQCTGI